MRAQEGGETEREGVCRTEEERQRQTVWRKVSQAQPSVLDGSWVNRLRERLSSNVGRHLIFCIVSSMNTDSADIRTGSIKLGNQ